MITSGPLTVHHSHPHSPVLHRYITVYLPSGSCHSDVTSLPPPLPLPLISRLDALTGSVVPNCLAARTRCAAHFVSFLRSCGDVTFLCVGPRMNEILDVITSKLHIKLKFCLFLPFVPGQLAVLLPFLLELIIFTRTSMCWLVVSRSLTFRLFVFHEGEILKVRLFA